MGKRASSRTMQQKDKSLAIFGISTLEDVYGVSRIKVPYRPKVDYPDGLDCTSADDVFRLYWRYTEPHGMSYMSTIVRELHLGGTHEEKLLKELATRKAKRIVLERGKPVPAWLKAVCAAWEPTSPRNELIRVVPSRGLPPGLNPDELNYFEKKAWQLIYAYMLKLPWPKTQMGLSVWRPVGQGKDANRKAADAKRPGIHEYEEEVAPGKVEKRTVRKARILTEAEKEGLANGTLTKVMLDEQGISLNAKARQEASNLQLQAELKGLGVWRQQWEAAEAKVQARRNRASS